MAVESITETAMIWGTVSSASMVGMVISLLLSVGLPIFLCIFIYFSLLFTNLVIYFSNCITKFLLFLYHSKTFFNHILLTYW